MGCSTRMKLYLKSRNKAKGMSEEEAEKEAEKDRDANKSYKYIINITYGEVNLTVPE